MALFEQFREETAAAECAQAAYHQSAAVPWLRSNRFWSALTPSGEEAGSFRIGQLERLAAEAEQVELACLGADEKREAQLAACRETLRPLALAEPQWLEEALRVPDDYSLLRRSFGLYPLFSLAVDWGAYNAYSDRREWFRRDLSEFTGHGEWRALGPATAVALAPDALSALLTGAARNPLAVPLPEGEDLRLLAEHFAPVVVQQLEDEIDRIGAPFWAGEKIAIDTAVPTGYYYADHLLFEGEPHLRLNYVFWYPARGGEKTPWIEAGDLDGLTIGLTLDRDGSLLLAQAMNNCGCYHAFFPGPRLGPQRPLPYAVDPLVPQPLPLLGGGKRFGLYLIAGWHQAVRVAAVTSPGEKYALRPYADLERLPRPDGTVRSMFDAKGIVPQSARIERFLFFSMGIDNVGAMRQRGHQPIVLVGREHYDQPGLLERNFLPR